jgi:hypothetical protein
MIAQTVALLSDSRPEFGSVVLSAVFGCTHHGGRSAAKALNKGFLHALASPLTIPEGASDAGTRRQPWHRRPRPLYTVMPNCQ